MFSLAKREKQSLLVRMKWKESERETNFVCYLIIIIFYGHENLINVNRNAIKAISKKIEWNGK